MDNNFNCLNCQAPVNATWNFCPNCGKMLRSLSLDTTIKKQIIIYFVSFFLAPFGLYWGLKYVRQAENRAKLIGIVSIALTIVAITGTLVYGYLLFNTIYGQLDNLR